MNKKERSPFLAMCKMWGKETAILKCKEFGISISEEELEQVEQDETRAYEAFEKLFEGFNKKDGA